MGFLDDFDEAEGYVVAPSTRPPHPFIAPRSTDELLAQSRYWVNAAGVRVRVKEMDGDYLFSSMRYLIKRSPDLHQTLKLYYWLSIDKLDSEELKKFFELSPEAWIVTTPLFQKMIDRYRKLNRHRRITLTPEEPIGGSENG